MVWCKWRLQLISRNTALFAARKLRNYMFTFSNVNLDNFSNINPLTRNKKLSYRIDISSQSNWYWYNFTRISFYSVSLSYNDCSIKLFNKTELQNYYGHLVSWQWLLIPEHVHLIYFCDHFLQSPTSFTTTDIDRWYIHRE
jgi:hypothetical protein